MLSDQPCRGFQPGDSKLPITERLEQRSNGHMEPYRQDKGCNWKLETRFKALSKLMG